MKVRDGNTNKNEIRKLSGDLRQEVKEILNEGKKAADGTRLGARTCSMSLATYFDRQLPTLNHSNTG
jgi:hypothetical protein